MPTGHCKFPEHHGSPGAVPTIAWIVIFAMAAIVADHWRTTVVCVIVAAVLVLASIRVLMLIHNHGSGYSATLEGQAELEARQRQAALLSLGPGSLASVLAG